jgi:hypothetical protein
MATTKKRTPLRLGYDGPGILPPDWRPPRSGSKKTKTKEKGK